MLFIWLDDQSGNRISLVESFLGFGVDFIGDAPQVVFFDWVASDSADLVSEPRIVEKGYFCEAVFLEVLVEGRVARSYGLGKDRESIDVLRDQVL